MKQGVLCKHCNPYEKGNKIYCDLRQCDVESYTCDKHNCPSFKLEPAVFVSIGVGRCDECPFERETRTPYAGCAYDYWCVAKQYSSDPRKIVGYVEYDSEIPPVPDWCPFRTKERK